MKKKCTCCGQEKEPSDFYVLRRKGIPALCSQCKECILKKRANYYRANIEQEKEKDRAWAAANRDRISEKEKRRYYRDPKKAIAYKRIWRDRNRERVREIDRARMAKYNATEKGKLSGSMAGRLRQSLFGTKSRRHWEDIVGYTAEQLKRHLEKQFLPGMTWDNYGKVWEIDHKIPIAAFNYKSPNYLDFKRCWELNNLRPLDRSENRKKQAKLNKPFQPALSFAA